MSVLLMSLLAALPLDSESVAVMAGVHPRSVSREAFTGPSDELAHCLRFNYLDRLDECFVADDRAEWERCNVLAGKANAEEVCGEL